LIHQQRQTKERIEVPTLITRQEMIAKHKGILVTSDPAEIMNVTGYDDPLATGGHRARESERLKKAETVMARWGSLGCTRPCSSVFFKS
jgi:hypothetical protein